MLLKWLVVRDSFKSSLHMTDICRVKVAVSISKTIETSKCGFQVSKTNKMTNYAE